MFASCLALFLLFPGIRSLETTHLSNPGLKCKFFAARVAYTQIELEAGEKVKQDAGAVKPLRKGFQQRVVLNYLTL